MSLSESCGPGPLKANAWRGGCSEPAFTKAIRRKGDCTEGT